MNNIRVITTNECNATILHKTTDSPGTCGFCFRLTDKIVTNIDTVKLVLNEICTIPEIKEAIFTGGEPLLFSYLKEALQESKNNGLYNTIHTNGILLSELSREIYPFVDCISLPIDGSKKNIVDYYRGEGYYHLLHNSIAEVKKNNVELGINTFVSKKNIDDLLNIGESISKLNPRYWFLSEFRDINFNTKNKFNYEYVLPDGVFIDKILEVKEKFSNVNIFYQNTTKDYPKRIWVSVDGNVYSNDTLNNKNIIVGNLKKDSLKNLVEKAGVLL